MKANAPRWDANLITPALRAWMQRVGAQQRNFRRYVVEEEDANGYKRVVATAVITDDGKFVCDSKEHAPDDDELKEIEASITGADFPNRSACPRSTR